MGNVGSGCVTPHDMFETGGKLLMLQEIYCPIARSVLRDRFFRNSWIVVQVFTERPSPPPH